MATSVQAICTGVRVQVTSLTFSAHDQIYRQQHVRHTLCY